MEEQESISLRESRGAASHSPGREIKEVYAFGAGLKSLCDLNLSAFRNLEFLSLHDNKIDRMEGLEALVSLRELNLSANRIKEMGGLLTLSQLQILNLSCNCIEEIKDLQGLHALEKLVLSHNRIKSLHGLSAVNGPSYSLRILDLQDNRVGCISELRVLTGCRHLKELSFSRGDYANPICQSPAYISSVIASAPHLYKLDGKLLSVYLLHSRGELPSPPQPLGDSFESYLDASVPSWVLQYAHISKSTAPLQDGYKGDIPHHSNSDNSQAGKQVVTSQTETSLVGKQQEIDDKRQDHVESKPSPVTPGSVDHEGTPLSEQREFEEKPSRQHAFVQTMNWTHRQMQSSQHRVPRPSNEGSWYDSGDSELEVVKVDEGVNSVSGSDNKYLHVAKVLNGVNRRRWPDTKSTLPSTGCKPRNVHQEFPHNGPLEDLAKRILDLVRELAARETRENEELQASGTKLRRTSNDAELGSSGCGHHRAAPHRSTGEETSFVPKDAGYSSSSDTSDKQEMNVGAKRRRQVRWSDEQPGKVHSRDSMRRWVRLVQNWMLRMVKHLHQAVISLNAVPKVETKVPLEKPVDILDETKENDIREGGSSHLLTYRAMEDRLAEYQHSYETEKKDLHKRLDAERQSVLELQRLLEEKEAKSHTLLEQLKKSFPCEIEEPAKTTEDRIRETIISAKARVLAMEESVQKATTAAQSAKVAFLNATADKENSKKLVISMYKALEEERANLKICKSELETCRSRCSEITKEHEKSKVELEKMFEGKQKELALVKMLHKQELESMRAIGVELGKSQGKAMVEEQSARIQHELRQELSDKQTELNEARKENMTAREDITCLQSAYKKEVAELKEVIQNLILKEKSKDAIILELSDVVRSQKAKLQALNFDESKLETAEKELQRKEQEINSLKLKALRCEELAWKVETLQQKLKEVTEEANENGKNEKNLEFKLMALQQENFDLASSVQRLEVSEDAVKIKNKMLDCQNETITALKKELFEAREAINRVSRKSETLETEWIKRLQVETEKGEDLRRELKSRDLAVDAVEEKLKLERAAKLAAERTSKLLQREVEEKEEMLRYVEYEISEVKNLYESKLRAFAAERDEAMEELEKTRKEMEQTKEALLKEAKNGRDLAAEAEKNQELQQARSLLQAQMQILESTIAEKDVKLKEAGRRVLELESQVDCQTVAMEKQKAVASSKVEQLRRVLEDLGDLK
ncbi:hypothetical protein R1sor_024447 [Riccia sorocarpa]|uniref:Leucine-rich repeat and coiled-coil domain-containing protein 1 n=1 Tax=Riccia sorocarpa TaxID=122646 RepID=A0ABD3GUL4_9MARC